MLALCRRLVIAAVALIVTGQLASADESGLSYWLPGSFASLAATPGVPGFSFAGVYSHTSVTSGSNVAASVALRRFPPATINFNLNADVKASADIAILTPSYVFATPVWGGQFSVTAFVPVGYTRTEIDANVTGALGPIGFAASRSIADQSTGFGDPSVQAALKWNRGVHNFMAYGRAGIPVGDYEAGRIANLGKGHGAFDAGGGYTYFNPLTGNEFSAVTGFTYNLKNESTDYQNGVDWHLDWGASKFLNKQFFIGAVGYFYEQLTGDSGSGAKLGDYKSGVIAVGPQAGYLFPVGDMQGFINVKSYWEFAAVNRSSGWNTWLVFSIGPAERHETAKRETVR